ncbi:hypothetical protein D3C86_2052100 [compost metagenome]
MANGIQCNRVDLVPCHDRGKMDLVLTILLITRVPINDPDLLYRIYFSHTANGTGDYGPASLSYDVDISINESPIKEEPSESY